jgi:hypothetical protein
VVGGQTRENTRQLAGIYGIAVVAALTQKAGEWSDGIDWTDTDYDVIDEDRSRTLMAAVVSLDVSVLNVLDVSAGPFGAAPPAGTIIPGLPDYGLADEVDTDVIVVPIGDALP